MKYNMNPNEIMNEQQQKELKEHFNNPKNNKKLEVFNGKGVCKNPDKKAKTTIFINVNNDEIVEDIGFLISGCKSTVLAGSLFSDTVKGESIDEGVRLCHELLADLEADLSPDKEKPRLVMHAFLAAVENYKDRKNGFKKGEKIKIIRSEEES